MTVAGTIEAIRIMQATAADLKAIIKGSTTPTYMTTVAQVLRPSFHWQDTAEVLAVIPRPALLLWPIGIGSAGYRIGGSSRRLFLRILIAGVVDTPLQNNMQDALLALWDDSNRVMLKNQARAYPGLASGPGMTSLETPGLSTDMDYRKESETSCVAAFTSTYDLDFTAPM